MNVDITGFLSWKEQTESNFFLAFLYAAVRAANSVPELRRRIRGEQVVDMTSAPLPVE